MGRPKISAEEVERYQFRAETAKVEKAMRLKNVKNVSVLVRELLDEYLKKR